MAKNPFLDLKHNSPLSHTVLSSEVIKNTKNDLYALFPDLKPKPKQEKDDRTHILQFGPKREHQLPEKLIPILDDAIYGSEVDELDEYTLTIYSGFKNSSSVIEAPGRRVGVRIIYNVGFGEIYHFERRSTIFDQKNEIFTHEAVDLNDKDIFFFADSCMRLGLQQTSNYEISVRSKPPSTIPGIITQNRKQTAPRRFIRPPSYHRLTVVVDIETSSKKLQKINEVIGKNAVSLNKGQLLKMVDQLKEGDNTVSTSITKKEIKEIRRKLDNKEGDTNPPQPSAPVMEKTQRTDGEGGNGKEDQDKNLDDEDIRNRI